MTIEKAISAGIAGNEISKKITGTYEVRTGAEII